MSQKNNIYKINNKKDLSSFFKKNGNDKHIMLSVILSTTSDIIKNMILSFMKDKQFSHTDWAVLFIYSVKLFKFG